MLIGENPKFRTNFVNTRYFCALLKNIKNKNLTPNLKIESPYNCFNE